MTRQLLDEETQRIISLMRYGTTTPLKSTRVIETLTNISFALKISRYKL
jgi:hypothetical protein